MKKQRCGHPIKAREIKSRGNKKGSDNCHQTAEKHGASHHGHHRDALEKLSRLNGVTRCHHSADDGPGQSCQIELRNVEFPLGDNQRHPHRSQQKTDHHARRRFGTIHDHFPKRHPQGNSGEHDGRCAGVGIVNREHKGKLPAVNENGAEKHVP